MLLVLVLEGRESLCVFGEVVVFLNIFLGSSIANRVMCISGGELLFSSDTDPLESLQKRVEGIQGFHTARDAAMALLNIHASGGEGRIVLVSGGEVDKKEEYVKALFAARKHCIPIDVVCPVNAISLLKSLSSGSFFHGRRGVFKHLLSTLSLCRDLQEVEKAKCVLHGKEISVGHVCPICLSLYCKFVPICQKCRTRFLFKK
jgi:transcription initiation factor TFIIH subunit 3